MCAPKTVNSAFSTLLGCLSLGAIRHVASRPAPVNRRAADPEHAAKKSILLGQVMESADRRPLPRRQGHGVAWGNTQVPKRCYRISARIAPIGGRLQRCTVEGEKRTPPPSRYRRAATGVDWARLLTTVVSFASVRDSASATSV
jgi:hypothetical protein